MELSTQTHFSQGWNTNLLSDIKQSGTDTIRNSVSWSLIEKKQGKYNFDHKSVAWVGDALEEGLNVVLVFNHTNKLYDGGNTVHSKKGLAAFADYVVATVKEFPGVTTIEIGNEFNGNNFVSGKVLSSSKDLRDDFYDSIVKAVDKALNEAGVDVQILGGATHSIPVDYLDKLDALGTLDMLDGISIHPYTTAPEQFADQLNVLRAAIGDDIAVHATEFGGNFANLSDAPPYLAKMLSVMAAADVASASWYAFAKQTYFANMELWDTSSAKATPAGVTYALFEQLLADGVEVDQIDIDAYTYFYSFGENAAVLWGEDREIALADGVSAFDLAGNLISDFSQVSPDMPVILRSAGKITAESFTLGGTGILADSFHDFDVTNAPGSLAGFEGPWSYFAENGVGATRALATTGGDIGGGQLWTPHLSADGLRPLRADSNAVVPVDFSSKSKPQTEWSVVERFTASKDGQIDIRGHWDVAEHTKDGVLLTIELNDKAIFEQVIYNTKNGHVFDLELRGIAVKAGDTIDFVIGSRANSAGDVTVRRIQIFDSAGVPDLVAGQPAQDAGNPHDYGDQADTVTVNGGTNADVIVGGSGDDQLVGNGGADTISGGEGDDRIYTDGQDLAIDGGDGVDTVFASGKEDFSIDLAASDVEFAYGAKGDDLLDASGLTTRTTLNGGKGADILIGGDQSDELIGANGSDKLYGGNGNDNLDGGRGTDLLDGGAGNDTLTGGRGDDTFQFADNFGHDTITDFEAGDIIDLTAIFGLDNFSDLSIHYANNSAIIQIEDSTITLTGARPHSLDADDFLI